MAYQSCDGGRIVCHHQREQILVIFAYRQQPQSDAAAAGRFGRTPLQVYTGVYSVASEKPELDFCRMSAECSRINAITGRIQGPMWTNRWTGGSDKCRGF
ncbi:hypothetical protein F2P81_005361 [Scophthalmus maximus]|uniref:Uncharacterized protein n=1 Tax=Scophthalmus maximus TaxID=52904 RepID=A0A6A4TAC3_SCOMX|nr:hypothetical protein F2P81_005361 [Scophthalmus maximus]